MRLLTHNQLICVVGGCKNNFPLKIVPTALEEEETEFNPEFLLHMLPNLDWNVVYHSATVECGLEGLPQQLPENLNVEEHGELLRAMHRALLEIHVTAGALVCNVCKREYPIQSSIPNMRLMENEVA